MSLRIETDTANYYPRAMARLARGNLLDWLNTDAGRRRDGTAVMVAMTERAASFLKRIQMPEEDPEAAVAPRGTCAPRAENIVHSHSDYTELTFDSYSLTRKITQVGEEPAPRGA
jgi:hypothetical protein